MNSPKVVVSLGLALIFSVILTACGGGSSTPPAPAGPPTLETQTLPGGVVNQNYSAILSAIGGTGAYTWSISSGSLPPGLTLNSSQGVISGTPTAVQKGGYSFTAQVTDAKGLSATANLSIYIEGVVSITPASLPSGSVGVPYSQTLMASGGLLPYTWCVLATGGGCDPTQAGLPAGLSLNTTTGVISGTPTTNGTPTNFMIQVTDAETSPGIPAVGGSSFSITIMSVTTTSLPPGNVNVPYSATLTVAGGVAPYTWAPTVNMPPGLHLDPNCVATKLPTCAIEGTPTKNGVYANPAQVTDSEKLNPAVATANLNLIIGPLTITTTSLPAGIVNILYSTTLGASGGVPPYTWCVLGSNGMCDPSQALLPPGLTMNSSGMISGTPTTPNSYSFTAQVTDSGSGSQQEIVSAPLTIVITPGLSNSNLSGSYAFTFSGYNNGTLVVMAGSFVTDGQGHIISGLLDYNDGTGEPIDNNGNPIAQTIAATSKYNINANGLGTMTLVTNMSPPSPFVFNVSITSDGNGRLIQSDSSQPKAYGSGQIITQPPTSQWPLCGSNVALGLFGLDSSLTARYAAAGQFQFDPSTCVDAENGVMDTNDGGNPSNATFTGAFNQYDQNTGRGIAGFTFNPGGRHFYAFYLVSNNNHKNNQLILVSTEPASKPAPLTLWSGLQQANFPTGWDNTRLTGTDVAELNALDNNVTADVTAGLFVGQGVTGHTCTSGQGGTPQFDPATLSYDENQGGTSSLQQTSNGTYCIDKTTGRVTLTAFNAGPFLVPPVFYMVTANQAFVVGTDPAVTAGYLEQQTGSPFTTSSIGGFYAGGTETPVTSMVTNAAVWLSADGSINMNGTQDTSGPNGPAQNNFNYTYSVDSTGRAVVKQSDGSTAGIMYVVGSAGSQTSPAKAVMLPVNNPGGQPNQNPALSVFNATVIP